jgi:hypothetical protein
MRLTRWIPAVVLVAVLVLTTSIAAGDGAKTIAPTRTQREGILKAFGDPPAASPCLIVRIAASKHNYGKVRFRTTKKCSKWAFNGVNILKHVNRNRWRILFEGSAYKCPLARIPRSVQRDLGVCP